MKIYRTVELDMGSSGTGRWWKCGGAVQAWVSGHFLPDGHLSLPTAINAATMLLTETA
jgi:hypothetical protein